MTRAPYDARRRPDPHGMGSLSPREREILRLYPQAGTQKALAVALGIRYQTVKNISSMLLRKLGCTTIGQAALLYDRLGRVCGCDCGCSIGLDMVCAFCGVGGHADRRRGERRK